MFSNEVADYFAHKGGDVFVPNLRSTNNYHVRLGENEIELLDRPGLVPIPLSAFDKVEECLNNGIHTPGNARVRLGDSKLDCNTIMYYIGRDVFGVTEGNPIIDNSCYLFAILDAAGCITRRRGYIDFA